MKWLGLLKEFKQINFTEEWYPCYCIHQLWLIIFSQTTYNLYSAENKVRRLKLRKKKQREIIKKKQLLVTISASMKLYLSFITPVFQSRDIKTMIFVLSQKVTESHSQGHLP